MIGYGSKRIVEKRPVIVKTSPWAHLEQPKPGPRTERYTVESFLEEVTEGTNYRSRDLIAIGIGTVETFPERKGKLLHLYLTPSGVNERNKGIAEPYATLNREIEMSIGTPTKNLDDTTLAGVVQMTQLLSEREFINWGQDNQERILVIYSTKSSDLTK